MSWIYNYDDDDDDNNLVNKVASC